MDKFALLVEICCTLSSSQCELFAHWTQYFQHFIQVILIFGNSFNLFRFEKEIVCHKFKNSTSQRPNISVMNIRMSKNDLRWTILSCLNAFSKVLISKASITHVDNFEEDFVIEVDFNIFPFHNNWIPFLLKLFLYFWISLIDGLKQLWLTILHLWNELLVFIGWGNIVRLLLCRWQFRWLLLLWLSLLWLRLLGLFLFDIICVIFLSLFVLLFEFFLLILWVFRCLKVFKILHTDGFDFVCLDLLYELGFFMRFEFNHYIFWFEICVDNVALIVKVTQS